MQVSDRSGEIIVRGFPSASGAFGRGPAFFVSFFSGKKKKRKKNCYQKKKLSSNSANMENTLRKKTPFGHAKLLFHLKTHHLDCNYGKPLLFCAANHLKIQTL